MSKSTSSFFLVCRIIVLRFTYHTISIITGFRPAWLLKLNSFMDIFQSYWKTTQFDTLQNSYPKELFSLQNTSMGASPTDWKCFQTS